MQALKALVIIMGVMIIAGMALLVYGLITHGSGGDAGDRAAASLPFAQANVALPAGATVESVSVDDGRAVVHVRLPGGGAELRVFDLATGAARGTIRLKAAP